MKQNITSLIESYIALITEIDKNDDYDKEEMTRFDKKYEAMTKEYAALDKYLAGLSATQNYIEKMLPKSEDSKRIHIGVAFPVKAINRCCTRKI